MFVLNIWNIKIRRISACVPRRIKHNREHSFISSEDLDKYIATTGIEQRHCVIHDGSICSSDLCVKAADKLISDLQWDRKAIDTLVFTVSSYKKTIEYE